MQALTNEIGNIIAIALACATLFSKLITLVKSGTQIIPPPPPKKPLTKPMRHPHRQHKKIFLLDIMFFFTASTNSIIFILKKNI